MNTSSLPQDLMINSLLHFENGVPIDDLALRQDQKRRLARVSHVYWQWIRNPFSVDYKALLRQLVKGHFADPPSETRAAQKDIMLFEYIRDTVSPMSRNEAKIKVQAAAEKMLNIGMETDNVMALDKGSRRLFEVAGLDKPENQQVDMDKIMFIPPVVVTDVSKIDETKENVDDAEMKRIMEKYGGAQDNKMKQVDDMVRTMEARSGVDGVRYDAVKQDEEQAHGEKDEQGGEQSQQEQ